MLAAGIPLDEALTDTRRIVGKGPLAEALEAMRVDVGRGTALHTAMARHPRCFEAHEITMVRAATRTGKMAPLFEQLAGRLEVIVEVRRQVLGGLAYPLILAFLACFLLPFPALVLSGVGAFTKAAILNIAVFAAGLVMLFVGLPALWSMPACREPMIDVMERLPGLKSMLRSRRFGLVFGLLSAALKAGVPLPEALRLATRASGEEKVALAGEKAVTALRAGDGLAAAIATLPGIDDESVGVVSAGERTGASDDATARRAELHEKRFRSAVKVLGRVAQVGGALLIAGVIAASVVGQMQRVFSDPMSMIPAGQRHELERELDRAQPTLPRR